MGIEELLRVVPPPEIPLETGDPTRWSEVERFLGIRLPKDLYDITTHYGSGSFCHDLWVLNPFAESYLSSVFADSRYLRAARGLPDRYGIPYGVFPNRPGWLPCGTFNSDRFCWVTEGEPDDWPLLLISDDCRSFQQVQMPLTTFLAHLLSGKLEPFLMYKYGSTYFDEPVGFQPFPTVRHSPPAGTRLPSALGGAEEVRRGYPWEGEWFPPDELGRPTGARVVIGPETDNNRWHGFAAEGFTRYPEWWHELPKPLHRWRRGQLLGWRLGGTAGTGFHNLIPLTRMAQMVLRAHEVAVTVAVYLGARMSCTVRATYEGANRYPSSVILEARYLPGFVGSGILSFLPAPNT